MGRPKSKAEMIEASETNYRRLMDFIAGMSEEELSTPFDFSSDPKKKEAHWARDRNLRDVLVHLYEWHQLLLRWVRSNMDGNAVPFLPAPYNWKTYGDMNVELWKKHQSTPLDRASSMLEGSHKEVMLLAEGFTDVELFSKDAFGWVGGSVLGSYFISVTSSHYDWALKKLKAHVKNCRSKHRYRQA